MHPSFKSLAITNALGLQASLMDFRHDTSFRSILEDDSISLASRAHIYSCSGKGAGLWLLLSHLFVHFTSHTLFSPQCYVFILVWFNPQHPIFSCVSVNIGWMHLALSCQYMASYMMASHGHAHVCF